MLPPGRLWPYLQTIDQAEKACQGTNTLPLIAKNCKLRTKRFCNISLRWCSTLGQAPCLAHKHQARLIKLARDEHSNLSGKFVNYRQKSFITLAQGQCYKTFYVCNLQIFVLRQCLSWQTFPAQSNKPPWLVQKIVNYGQKGFIESAQGGRISFLANPFPPKGVSSKKNFLIL